jgi:hypothetical protein
LFCPSICNFLLRHFGIFKLFISKETVPVKNIGISTENKGYCLAEGILHSFSAKVTSTGFSCSIYKYKTPLLLRFVVIYYMNYSQKIGKGLGAGKSKGLNSGLGAGEPKGLNSCLGAGEPKGLNSGLEAGKPKGLNSGLGAGKPKGLNSGLGAGKPKGLNSGL